MHGLILHGLGNDFTVKIKVPHLIVAVLICLSFLAGFILSDRMPERMASHWNAAGEVDGYMPKTWALYLLPVLTALLAVFIAVLPSFDPLKANVDKFRGYYDWFIVVFTAFMTYLYAISLLWNLGLRFNMIQLLVPAFAVLFFFIGVLLENSKMNWFIGIRTPWTLSSETVWDRTHRLGGRLFKAAGVVCLAGLVLHEYAILLVLAPVILAAIYAVVYSYLEYRRQH